MNTCNKCGWTTFRPASRFCGRCGGLRPNDGDHNRRWWRLVVLSIVGVGVWLVAKDPSITKALGTAAVTPASAGWPAPPLPKFKVQFLGNSIRVTSIGEEPVTVLAFVINNRSGVNGCDSKVRQQDLQKNLDAAAEATAEARAEAEREAAAAKAKAHSLEPAASAAEAKARAAAVQPARREAAEAARAAAQAKADALEPELSEAEGVAQMRSSWGHPSSPYGACVMVGASCVPEEDWKRVMALRQQVEELKIEATSRPPDIDWTGLDRTPVVLYQEALKDANKAREAASAAVQAGAQQKQDIIDRDLREFGPKLPVGLAQGDTLTLPVSDACGAELVQIDLHTDRGDVKYGLTD